MVDNPVFRVTKGCLKQLRIQLSSGNATGGQYPLQILFQRRTRLAEKRIALAHPLQLSGVLLQLQTAQPFLQQTGLLFQLRFAGGQLSLLSPNGFGFLL